MNRMKATGVLMIAALGLFAMPASAQDEDEVAEVIQKFQEGDPGMQGWFAEAYGYAVFPSVGKGGIGIGGARGKGLVYEQGRLVGKTTLTQVTVGFQLGGQEFSEVIFFKDKTAFDDFTIGLNVTESYDSRPPSEAATKRDFQYAFSIGWSWS